MASVTLVWMAWLVDDWRRDFTTNTAATDPAAEHPDQRPLRVDRLAEQVAEAVREWAEQRPRWKVEQQEDTEGGIRIHLTRRTRIFRFTDDIHVTIRREPDSGETTLTVHSQSRVGKGDLGQNPRNIRDLVRGVRERM